jgi:voltage-gated potassium channel Kch
MSPSRDDRAGLAQRLRYRFDSAMSRGPAVIILWLAVVTVGFVFLVAVVLTVFGVGINEDTDPTLLERFWQSFLRILDPGTFSDDAGWPLRIAMLIVTLLGVLIGGSLIGLIVASVDNRVEQLRRGRSLVVERDHALILGWSPRVFTLVAELVIANENQPEGCIVVLAPHEKPDMEEELRTRVGGTGRTRIVCRTGDPSSPQDLGMVNVGQARSIIALGTGEEDGPGDAEAVKAVLAVLSLDRDADTRVVAELNDAQTARALREAGHGRVITVRAAEVISRITAQACRESGLSTVWRDLLDFEGDEVYFFPAPELEGRTFGDALLAYDTSSVIGIRRHDGSIAVNPPVDTSFGSGDMVIAISADDDTLVFSGWVDDGAMGVESVGPQPARPERFLVIGWSQIGPVVVRELDQFASTGSVVDVLVDPDLVDERAMTTPKLEHLRLTFRTTHGNLDELGTRVAEHVYDKVVVLGYRRGISPPEADARSLLTLLLLQRSLRTGRQMRPPPIVTELLDSRDVELARATGADDFVVSDELSSLMLAQLSERPELEVVFEDLLDTKGSAIALRPAHLYTRAESGPFRHVVAGARTRGEVAIGYRRAGEDGVMQNVLNPPKSSEVRLGPADAVVVIGPV